MGCPTPDVSGIGGFVAKLVRDSGPKNARVVIVGEAPGAVEEQRGLPFLGPSGGKLSFWLSRVGLSRPVDCYITNTYPFRPPGNKLDLIPLAEREHWIDQLHDRIAALTNPRVIVPMGNYALQAITGKRGILNHRGSIYQYVDRQGRKIKVVPCLHPALTLYEPSKEAVCMRDWERIVEELQSRKLRRPKRLLHIAPTVKDVWDYLEARKADGLPMAVDIETPATFRHVKVKQYKNGNWQTRKERTGKIVACIAFAHSATEAICIPLTSSYWSTKAQRAEVLGYVRELLALHNPKIFQYGWFDTYCLRRLLGFSVRNWWWDTKDMHHCLEPNDSHSLAYMASRDTREPYWKDEGKGQGRGVPQDLQTFWTYNAKDAAVTRELYEIYKARLEATSKMSLYRRSYRALYRPVLSMSLRGLRMDEKRRQDAYGAYTAICTDLKAKLRERAGEPIYGAKGSLSPAKLQHFLYDTLGLKEQLKKDKKTGLLKRTSDEVAVRTIQRRYAHKGDIVQVCQWILDHKRFDKLRQFVSEKIADEDGRMRSSYSFSPVTGRFSSGKNACDTGANAQNQDREIRDIYLPDVGHLFLEADLSQAESRIVFMLTGDKELVELARTPPWEYDVHTANAARLYKIAEADVTKTQRYLGKRAVHAGHYGMQGKKLSDVFLLDGYAVPVDEAQKLIDAYLEWRHPVVNVFQKDTRLKIMRDRRLENVWGRTVSFAYERMSDDLFRLGYAWVPQSTVPDIVNRWGIVPLHKAKLPARLHLQGHDSMLVSVRPENVWDVMEFLKQSLERPLAYTTPLGRKARELTIPVEFKLSVRWASPRAAKEGDVIEWKKPPDEEEVRDAVKALRRRMVG